MSDRSFVDLNGRRWSILITVADKARLRKDVDFDLGALLEEDCLLLTRLAGDPEYLVRVLYCVLERDMQAAGVSPDEFAATLGGDCLQQAFEALVQGLIDFFPRSRARDALRGIVAKIQEATEAALAGAVDGIAAIDAAAEARRSIERSGVAQASSASTPAPSA